MDIWFHMDFRVVSYEWASRAIVKRSMRIHVLFSSDGIWNYVMIWLQKNIMHVQIIARYISYQSKYKIIHMLCSTNRRHRAYNVQIKHVEYFIRWRCGDEIIHYTI